MTRLPRPVPAAFLAATILLVHGAVLASSPITWEYPAREHRTGAAADEGVPAGPGERESVDGISRAGDGRLSLSVPMREVFPASSTLAAPPLLWAAGLDAGGNLYLGTGNSGEVLQIDRKGLATPLFDSDDLGVRAVAVTPSGELYIATFPEGAVFRLRPGEEPEPWFAPEERYLWALAADPSGRLFVATGERGIIYQVKGKADGDVFFDSDESHIMSLAFDRDGSLIAGTDPDGLVYRISPRGKPEVLLDTDLREIPALVVTPDGVIYAAALGEEPRRPQRKPGEKSDLTIEVTPAPDGNVLEEQADLSRKITIDLGELLPSLSKQSEGIAGRIYRIAPGQPPELVWKSNTQRVYSLAWAVGRGLFFGTGGTGGDEARIYHLEEDGAATTLYRLAERQVTSLLAHPDGRLYACTSNPGRVYVLDTGTVSAGTYMAPVYDAGRAATWGTLSWEASIPPGTRIEIATRSGNRPAPDESWSGWSEPAATSEGSAIQSPPGRYLQWKAELSRIKTDEVPVLEHVRLTALPENRTPVIDGLVVMEPKKGYVKPGPHAGATPPATGASAVKPAGDDPPGAEDKDRTLPPPGTRWVVWMAGDPDGDDLTRSISLRRADEPSFRPIATDIPAEPYALADADLAEGRYLLRLEVDDSPTNGPRRMLDATLISDTFLVDHTAPRLTILPSTAAAPAGRLVARVEAADPIGIVARGEYSTSGSSGPWKPLPCEDGICDTSMERFLVDVPAGPASARLSVRVSDAAGNSATIEVPPASR